MKAHPSHDFTSRRCTHCGEDVLSLEARYQCRPVPDEPEEPDELGDPDDLEAEDLEAIAVIFGHDS